VRVALAEDSVLLREGIVRLLKEEGFEVVGAASSAPELLDLVEAHEPHVCVVDIRMPPTHTDEGLRAAHAIRDDYPGVGVLILSQHVDLGLALKLVERGVEGLGYLLKDRISEVAEFADSIRRVGEGGSAIDPSLVSQLLSLRREADELARLTRREKEVLGLMAQGYSNVGIAERLVISVSAAEKHVAAIFDKLGLHNTGDTHRRVLAVLTYLHA
jgi:DNA-binding NarL/FixJ family response regulator